MPSKLKFSLLTGKAKVDLMVKFLITVLAQNFAIHRCCENYKIKKFGRLCVGLLSVPVSNATVEMVYHGLPWFHLQRPENE